MNSPAPSEPQQSSVDFLLAEYHREADSMRSDEESGDKRIAFLWTLVGAYLAGFGALAMSDDTAKLERGFALLLFFGVIGAAAVALFGWYMFLRTLRRNTSTDSHKRNLDRIRRYFVERDPAVAANLPNYGPPEPRTFGQSILAPYGDWKLQGEIGEKSRQKGGAGYAETIALLNSLVIAFGAALLGLLVVRLCGQTFRITATALLPFAAIGVFAMIGMWEGQAKFAAGFYQREFDKHHRPTGSETKS